MMMKQRRSARSKIQHNDPATSSSLDQRSDHGHPCTSSTSYGRSTPSWWSTSSHRLTSAAQRAAISHGNANASVRPTDASSNSLHQQRPFDRRSDLFALASKHSRLVVSLWVCSSRNILSPEERGRTVACQGQSYHLGDHVTRRWSHEVSSCL
jgi:hypothetical protein